MPNQTAALDVESQVGGVNSATNTSAAIGAATAIHGRRRPQRVCVWSESQPTNGSMIASSTRASAPASATQASGTSTVSE